MWCALEGSANGRRNDKTDPIGTIARRLRDKSHSSGRHILFGHTMMACKSLDRLLLALLPLFTNCLVFPIALRRPSIQLCMGRSLGALQELIDEGGHKSTDSHDAPCLVDFGNFWRKTRANYTACEKPDRHPDFKSKGSGGSKYWDMGDYVIRYSNHWSGQHGIGRIVDCEWAIDVNHDKKEYVTGMCRYEDFIKGKLSSEEKKKMRKKSR